MIDLKRVIRAAVNVADDDDAHLYIYSGLYQMLVSRVALSMLLFFFAHTFVRLVDVRR